MSGASWRQLVSSFVEGRVDAATFHDRFFDLWHDRMRDGGAEIPEAIQTLFYVVEAYCPDPSLRNPDSPYEADDIELAEAARQADAGLRHAFQ